MPFKLIFGLLIIFHFFVPNVAFAELNLTMGLYATERPHAVKKQFLPIVNYLENALEKDLVKKVNIKLVIVPTYDEGIQNIASGKFDFTRLGPASLIEVRKQNSNVSLLAMEQKKGKKVFYGVICVEESSPINSIDDLKGKTFAFGDERSTIGRYLAQSYLLENGIKAKDLANFKYLGRHDRVGKAVSNKAFDAGALKESTFKKLVKQGYKLRTVAKLKNVTKPWVAREGLEISITKALSRALLNLKDKTVLKSLKKDGFTKANWSDFETIEDSMTKNGKFFN